MAVHIPNRVACFVEKNALTCWEPDTAHPNRENFDRIGVYYQEHEFKERRTNNTVNEILLMFWEPCIAIGLYYDCLIPDHWGFKVTSERIACIPCEEWFVCLDAHIVEWYGYDTLDMNIPLTYYMYLREHEFKELLNH